MSKTRELSDYLNDILTAINDVEEFIDGMSYESFSADKKPLTPSLEALKSLVKPQNIFRYRSGKNIPIFLGVKWPVCETSSFMTIWVST
jgi:hypothetical protein